MPKSRMDITRIFNIEIDKAIWIVLPSLHRRDRFPPHSSSFPPKDLGRDALSLISPALNTVNYCRHAWYHCRLSLWVLWASASLRVAIVVDRLVKANTSVITTCGAVCTRQDPRSSRSFLFPSLSSQKCFLGPQRPLVLLYGESL